LAWYVTSRSPRIEQAYILFRARLAAPFTFGAGEETQEAAMFSPEDIPFSEVRRRRMPDHYHEGTRSVLPLHANQVRGEDAPGLCC